VWEAFDNDNVAPTPSGSNGNLTKPSIGPDAETGLMPPVDTTRLDIWQLGAEAARLSLSGKLPTPSEFEGDDRFLSMGKRRQHNGEPQTPGLPMTPIKPRPAPLDIKPDRPDPKTGRPWIAAPEPPPIPEGAFDGAETIREDPTQYGDDLELLEADPTIASDEQDDGTMILPDTVSLATRRTGLTRQSTAKSLATSRPRRVSSVLDSDGSRRRRI